MHKDDSRFFKQAVEAIITTSSGTIAVDPAIKELLSRLEFNTIPLNPQQRVDGSGGNVTVNEPHFHATTSHKHSVAPVQYGVVDNKAFADLFHDSLSGHDIFKNSIDHPQNNAPDQLRDKSYNRSNTNTRSDEQLSHQPSLLEERQFPCNKCELVFRRSSDLRRHERAHLPVLPNICSLCGKGFARKDALKRHFDTLTCKRNRSKLLGIGGDINEILERARLSSASI